MVTSCFLCSEVLFAKEIKNMQTVQNLEKKAHEGNGHGLFIILSFFVFIWVMGRSKPASML